MTPLRKIAIKRETLNIRIKPAERGLIDSAAQMQGKNRTEFILDAACKAAEETLLDQALIMATPEAYQEFLSRLDKKPQPNHRLQKTMRTIAPWEKENE